MDVRELTNTIKDSSTVEGAMSYLIETIIQAVADEYEEEMQDIISGMEDLIDFAASGESDEVQEFAEDLKTDILAELKR